MTTKKVTESTAAVTPVTSIDTATPAHVMPYSMNPITATMQAMTSVVLTEYLTAFYADTEAAVTNGQLSPVLKLILDKGFARHWTEHNSTFSKLPESAKLASIQEAFKYWNVGVLTKSAYDSLFKTATVTSRGKTAEPVIDYTPLVTELQLMHDSTAYNAAQAEDIAIIVAGLSITASNTAVQAKGFYDVLTTSEDLADLQVYIKTALKAHTERSAAAAAAEKTKTEREEAERKAAILARFKRG